MKTGVITVGIAILTLLPAHASTVIFNGGSDVTLSSPNASKTEAAIRNADSITGVTFHQSLLDVANTDIVPRVVAIRDISSSDFSIQQFTVSDQALAQCAVTDERDLLTLILALAFSRIGLVSQALACGLPEQVR
jgi:hypothetical protein